MVVAVGIPANVGLVASQARDGERPLVGVARWPGRACLAAWTGWSRLSRRSSGACLSAWPRWPWCTLRSGSSRRSLVTGGPLRAARTLRPHRPGLASGATRPSYSPVALRPAYPRRSLRPHRPRLTGRALLTLWPWLSRRWRHHRFGTHAFDLIHQQVSFGAGILDLARERVDRPQNVGDDERSSDERKRE